MKYYKDTNNQVYAYMANGSEDKFIKPDLVAISAADAEVIANTPPPMSLAEAKKQQLAVINSGYSQSAAALKITTPEAEVLTWDIQKIEAEAWVKDSDEPTPFCDGIAKARGLGREVLLGRILEKVAVYNQFMSFLTGLRQKYEDRIHAAESMEDVLTITWDTVLTT